VTHAHYLSVSLSSRETYLLLVRTIARHLRTYIRNTYELLVAPQTPFPELGLQPSDRQTDSATTEIRGPPHPLSRTRVTTLGQNDGHFLPPLQTSQSRTRVYNPRTNKQINK